MASAAAAAPRPWHGVTPQWLSELLNAQPETLTAKMPLRNLSWLGPMNAIVPQNSSSTGSPGRSGKHGSGKRGRKTKTRRILGDGDAVGGVALAACGGESAAEAEHRPKKQGRVSVRSTYMGVTGQVLSSGDTQWRASIYGT